MRAWLEARWQLLVVVGIYLVAISVLGYLRVDRSTDVSYVAARELPPNHLLRDEDFTRPTSGAGAWGWFLPDRDTVVGRYVAMNGVQKDKPIMPATLLAIPALPTAPGARAVFVPLDAQPHLSTFLNAGRNVSVVGPGTPAGGNVSATVTVVAPRTTVSAVVCPKPADPKSCYAILTVSPSEEANMTGDKLGKLRLIPVQ
jgi:hypothetical protein